jgi:iron complex outermembrane receptor protein
MKIPFATISLFSGLAAAAAPIALLDETVVTASPLARPLVEQTQSVSLLTGERLRLALQPTLGETLSRTPGVNSTYFGPAASRPVIRGLDGDRIRVLQNGSNTLDVSATSVDHAVSFDPVSIESVEVVRGPATLRYGPNAIGGVVNVRDNRIPEKRLEAPVRGRIEGRYGSVNSERGGAFVLEGGVGGFQWHLEGYKRATDELHIPGEARSARLRRLEPLEPGEKEARDVLPNSDLRTEGLSGGASYVWDDGYFGLAYSGFHTNYGTVAEPDVTIDMEQRRWDFRGAFFGPFAGVKAIEYRVGLSDYEHTEFEGALPGTRFENEGYDARLELQHEKIGPFEGALGFQSERSDFSALGEEAFLPPVETRVQSVFLFEEAVLDPVRWQFGVRYDHVTVESATAPGFGAGQERTFDHVSASAGLLYSLGEAYVLALHTAFTQRAPTYQELFAFGPHVATDAFEIGDPGLESEKAFSLDLSLRKRAGRVTGAVGLFYYRYSDYIGLFATGAEADELPVFAYRATDAAFYGGEAELTVHLLDLDTTDGTKGADGTKCRLDLELKADYVHASDRSADEPLPRIPPFRASAALRWQADPWNASVEGQYAARQNRTAERELPTDSYFLLNASVGYRAQLGAVTADFYVQGVNLTDAEARLHTSFLKDIAPLGGRGVVTGVKFEF